MLKKVERKEARRRRHLRVRKKVMGTPERPRLSVYRSLRHIYAQVIDDQAGRTLVAASTLEPELRSAFAHCGNKQAAAAVGKLIAQRALEKGITAVVFDRGGNIYHGCIKELAEAARAAGLKF